MAENDRSDCAWENEKHDSAYQAGNGFPARFRRPGVARGRSVEARRGRCHTSLPLQYRPAFDAKTTVVGIISRAQRAKHRHTSRSPNWLGIYPLGYPFGSRMSTDALFSLRKEIGQSDNARWDAFDRYFHRNSSGG